MLLKYKMLLLTIVPLTVVLLVIGGLTINNKASIERELLLQRLNSYRVLIESGDLSFETSSDKVKLEALLDEKVEFSEILGKNYAVIYSSENSAAPLFTEAEKEEIDEAFQGIETTKNIEAREGKRAAFVIISPLIVNNKVVAVLHQGLSNEKSGQRVREYAIYIFVSILGGVLICFVLISILSKRVILRNIYSLKQTATEISNGNLDYQIRSSSNDELGELAKHFNTMTEALRSQRQELKGYSSKLEKEVAERTKELTEKNEELEKFNRLAVGRELRMVELKNKIKNLEKDLESKKQGG